MGNFDVEKHKIFECISGSRLYGLNKPNSDFDYRGVVIPPMEVLLNPFENFEQKDKGFEEEDRTLYALGKFFKLCADANPNIVELLFVPQSHILFKTPHWNLILQNKHLFLSKKAKYTFTGYAFSQLKSIQSHRVWFTNPPDHKPTREEFGLMGHRSVSTKFAELVASGDLRLEYLNEEYATEARKEFEYAKAKEVWDNYMSWFNGRNPERKALEEKFGYDTKMASHLFRLMLEGRELLLEGKITFPLPEAEFVLAVKEGRYTYEEVLEMAKDFDNQFQKWHDVSDLPKAPDRKKLTDLYYQLLNVRF